MRRHVLLDGLASIEMLDLRLSPSTFFSGAYTTAPAVYHISGNHDDPLPAPSQSHPYYSSNDPPITQPPLPPTGPVGPGSTS